jgi:hypothetical protein
LTGGRKANGSAAFFPNYFQDFVIVNFCKDISATLFLKEPALMPENGENNKVSKVVLDFALLAWGLGERAYGATQSWLKSDNNLSLEKLNPEELQVWEQKQSLTLNVAFHAAAILLLHEKLHLSLPLAAAISVGGKAFGKFTKDCFLVSSYRQNNPLTKKYIQDLTGPTTEFFTLGLLKDDLPSGFNNQISETIVGTPRVMIERVRNMPTAIRSAYKKAISSPDTGPN